MQYLTYTGLFRSHIKKNVLLYDFGIIFSSSIFIALSAQISLYLPFSAIPVTGQTFAVLLTGILLGSRRGFLAVLLYLTEGISGLPVFASGNTGPLYLLGPTGGYLLGFIPAVYLAGLLAESGWDRRFITAFFAVFLGNIIIYIAGISWLARFVGPDKLLMVGLIPFIPGAIIKMVLAALLLPTGWKIIKRYQ